MMNARKTITSAALAAALVALAACGGSDAPAGGCVARADFDAALAAGIITERPALRAGDVWADPVILRPTRTAYGTTTYVAHGPYHLPGELPSWVCR